VRFEQRTKHSSEPCIPVNSSMAALRSSDSLHINSKMELNILLHNHNMASSSKHTGSLSTSSNTGNSLHIKVATNNKVHSKDLGKILFHLNLTN
jgi:hypothetical protein